MYNPQIMLRPILKTFLLMTIVTVGFSTVTRAQTLSGDYDYYVMLGAAPNGGFEARRRMGFAHFDGPSANGAWFKRRSGAPLFTITKVTVTNDNITVSLDNGSEIVAVLKGDTIEGRTYRGGKPIDRIWLVKRTDPIAWESNYALWQGGVSQPTFQVTVDPVLKLANGFSVIHSNSLYRPREWTE